MISVSAKKTKGQHAVVSSVSMASLGKKKKKQSITDLRASLLAQRSTSHQPMQETWVPSLDWEDPLEKEMATYSSILAWEILWTTEPGGLQSVGSPKSWT